MNRSSSSQVRGIGLVTAKRAAQHGARVVLVARNENDLRAHCAEIRRTGGVPSTWSLT